MAEWPGETKAQTQAQLTCPVFEPGAHVAEPVTLPSTCCLSPVQNIPHLSFYYTSDLRHMLELHGFPGSQMGVILPLVAYRACEDKTSHVLSHRVLQKTHLTQR